MSIEQIQIAISLGFSYYIMILAIGMQFMCVLLVHFDELFQNFIMCYTKKFVV